MKAARILAATASVAALWIWALSSKGCHQPSGAEQAAKFWARAILIARSDKTPIGPCDHNGEEKDPNGTIVFARSVCPSVQEDSAAKRWLAAEGALALLVGSEGSFVITTDAVVAKWNGSNWASIYVCGSKDGPETCQRVEGNRVELPPPPGQHAS